MEPGIAMIDKLMKLYLRHAFIRNGSVTLQHDENGEATRITLASKDGGGLGNAVCPYCEGTNNAHEVKNTGLVVKAEGPHADEVMELEINGFRCASCSRTWLMLVSDKGRAFSLGFKAAQAS